MEERENIHTEVEKYTTKQLYDACEYYIQNNNLSESVRINKEDNPVFYHFMEYYEALEGHDGWSVRSHTYEFLLHKYFERMVHIVNSNTYDHNQMNGTKILDELGLNNEFNMTDY